MFNVGYNDPQKTKDILYFCIIVVNRQNLSSPTNVNNDQNQKQISIDLINIFFSDYRIRHDLMRSGASHRVPGKI